MGAWGAIAEIAGCVAVGVLLVVLAWAANERGQMHHLAALVPRLKKDAASLWACRSPGAGTPSLGGGVGTPTEPSLPDIPKGDLP